MNRWLESHGGLGVKSTSMWNILGLKLSHIALCCYQNIDVLLRHAADDKTVARAPVVFLNWLSTVGNSWRTQKLLIDWSMIKSIECSERKDKKI